MVGDESCERRFELVNNSEGDLGPPKTPNLRALQGPSPQGPREAIHQPPWGNRFASIHPPYGAV